MSNCTGWKLQKPRATNQPTNQRNYPPNPNLEKMSLTAAEPDFTTDWMLCASKARTRAHIAHHSSSYLCGLGWSITICLLLRRPHKINNKAVGASRNSTPVSCSSTKVWNLINSQTHVWSVECLAASPSHHGPAERHGSSCHPTLHCCRCPNRILRGGKHEHGPIDGMNSKPKWNRAL